MRVILCKRKFSERIHTSLEELSLGEEARFSDPLKRMNTTPGEGGGLSMPSPWLFTWL